MSSLAKNSPPDSFWPEAPEDPLGDILREAVERWKGNIPATLAEFRTSVVLIAQEALEEAGTAAAGRAALSLRERETIARLVSEFIEAKNPRMVAQCYDLTFGLGLMMGRSQNAIADENGVGKAAVSKVCRAIVRNFDLPPARGMKSPAAVEGYRKRQLQKHRDRRAAFQPWAMAEAFAQGLTGSGSQ